jgi:hypothetical protein
MSIPSCFANYIGIRSLCNPSESKYDLYIDDLEGISLDVAASITNGYDTPADVLWKSVYAGINLTLMDFKNYARPYFRIKSVLSTFSLGKFNKDYFSPSVDTHFRGIKINLNNSPQCKCCTPGQSKMLRVYIEKLEILGNSYCPNKQIVIQDGGIDTYYNVELQPTQITEIYLNYPIVSNEVVIWIDNWDFSPNIGSLQNPTQNTYNHCCQQSPYAPQQCISLQGWDAGNTNENLNGIKPHFKIACDENQLYCAIGEPLKYLFLYRAGMEFLKRWKTSPRYNEHTQQKENIEEIYKNWNDIYDKNYKNIHDTFKQLFLNFDNCCIECKGIKHIYSL